MLTDNISIGDNCIILFNKTITQADNLPTIIIIHLMECLLCVSQEACIAVIIRGIQDYIDLICIRIILIVIIMSILIAYALIPQLCFSTAELPVNINIRCRHEHMDNVIVYSFSKHIKDLGFHLKFHDLLCHIVIFSISLQITHILTDHLYDFFQNIICGILVFPGLSEAPPDCTANSNSY